MCVPAGFVVTKKQVFWSKTKESHEEIIKENNLREKNVRGEPMFVRVEIVPPDDNYTLPFSKWEYTLDENVNHTLPAWYVKKNIESRCRSKLKEWRKCKIIMPKEKRTLKDNDFILICYGTVKYMYGSSTVITYVKLNKDILYSPQAVLIDRSGVRAKCFVGK